MYKLCITLFHAEAMTGIDMYLRMRILDSVLAVFSLSSDM